MQTSTNLSHPVTVHPLLLHPEAPAIANQPALLIEQNPISLRQVLRTLQAARSLQPVLEEMVSRYVLEQTFQQRSELAIQPAELDQAIRQFQQQHHLTQEQFQAWLVDNAWDELVFRSQLIFDLKVEKLKTQLAKPKLLEAFVDKKLDLDQVVLSRIVVEPLDLAEELLESIRAGDSFEQLARDYSCSDDALTNGMMGQMSRADAQRLLGIDPFQVAPQTVLDPIACADRWCLFRVEAILPAVLDEQVTQYLQDEIFQQWLIAQMQGVLVELRGLEEAIVH